MMIMVIVMMIIMIVIMMMILVVIMISHLSCAFHFINIHIYILEDTKSWINDDGLTSSSAVIILYTDNNNLLKKNNVIRVKNFINFNIFSIWFHWIIHTFIVIYIHIYTYMYIYALLLLYDGYCLIVFYTYTLYRMMSYLHTYLFLWFIMEWWWWW
jgi:hypothetical protein